jgi:hypothetical protein
MKFFIKKYFIEKALNFEMFDFRFNTPTPFPESGSRKRFHASGMRGIDFSHKITPRKVIFAKIKKKIFSENGPQLLPHFNVLR